MTDLRGRPFFLTPGQEAWVRSTLAGMDQREKIGQLFCVMGGDYAPEELEALVRERSIGAVLFRPCPKRELAERFRAIDAAAKYRFCTLQISRRAEPAQSRTGPSLQISSA